MSYRAVRQGLPATAGSTALGTAVDHLTRRGATYWWQRRIPAAIQLDGCRRLARSLRTADPALARRRARACSVVFDHVMLALLADGSAAEVGIVGFEGMIGLPLLLGSDRAITEAMIQAPGTFLRLGKTAFQEEQDRSPAFRKLLLRYVLACQAQVAQTAACNGRHTLDQRLARWLLTAHDRAHGDDFPMMQEFLLIMLCVHRSGVTVAARLFQQAGLIRYSNGQITVTDRVGLEAAACKCHGVVAGEFERLLGPAWGANPADRDVS